jgi:hypothetical protein
MLPMYDTGTYVLHGVPGEEGLQIEAMMRPCKHEVVRAHLFKMRVIHDDPVKNAALRTYGVELEVNGQKTVASVVTPGLWVFTVAMSNEAQHLRVVICFCYNNAEAENRHRSVSYLLT